MNKIRERIPTMGFEGGRRAVADLADGLETLPPQLHVQFVCQVNLLHNIVFRAITYFAQHLPVTLRAVRWRIDQKNSTKTRYEKTFERLAPALLQTRSFEEPLLMVNEFGYSHFESYESGEGKVPDFLQKEYGLPLRDAINVQKLVRNNLRF